MKQKEEKNMLSNRVYGTFYCCLEKKKTMLKIAHFSSIFSSRNAQKPSRIKGFKNFSKLKSNRLM
jgi:hypothetical protein